MGLATAGLAICKHGSIEATNDLGDHLLCGVPVYKLCRAAFVEYIVQGVGLSRLLSRGGTSIDLIVVHLPGTSLLKLCLAKRPDPDADTAIRRARCEVSSLQELRSFFACSGKVST